MDTLSIPALAADRMPWYRQPWPWLLMAGPAAVVVAGTVTASIAFSRQDALVVDDYYKQGSAINQDLRRDRAAARLQLAAELRYEPAAARLAGEIAGDGRPYTGRIAVTLVHSTQPSKDIRLQAQPDAQGRFTVALPLLDMANWQVLVEGERRDWRLQGEWHWPQQAKIMLAAEAGAAQ